MISSTMQSLTDLTNVGNIVNHANLSFAQFFTTSSENPDTGGVDDVANHFYDIDTSDESAYCHQVALNNMSYLNISCETNLDYSVPLYGIFTPILLPTTIVANTLIVLVLSKRNMATPTNLVLMGK